MLNYELSMRVPLTIIIKIPPCLSATTTRNVFAALFGGEASADAVAFHDDVDHEVEFGGVLAADNGRFVSPRQYIWIITQESALVDEQGVHGADAGWIFSHPARNIHTGDLLAVAGGVDVEEADFVVGVLGGEGFVGRRDVDEDFAALAGGEQVAEDVAVGESLAGLLGAEGAPVEGGVGNGRYRFQ